jgi:hypothetical protein
VKRAPNTSSRFKPESPVHGEPVQGSPQSPPLHRLPSRVQILRATAPRRSHVGINWKNCGASAAQNQLSQEQANFYQELSANYATVFPEQQSILASLTSEFTPILNAGPNQTGFSAPEEAALRTQASDTTARAAQEADVALGGKEASMGDASIPSGAKLQLESGLLNSAAEENAGLQNQITQEDYAVGRENFLNAAGALDTAAGLQNPNAFAGAATSAGSAANTTMNDITQENQAWMGPVFGMLGGIGSAVAGIWAG